MTHPITADHLVDAASKAVTEDLFNEFNKALQSFCNEEKNRIVIFRTLRYTRIRLHALRQYPPQENALTHNMQGRFLDIAIGYVNTELDLLRRCERVQDMMQPNSLHRWTGTIVELVELIYALHEMKRIDDSETAMNELAAFFGEIFGVKLDARYLYNAYTDIKQRKNDSRTFFLDKMRERLNLRMQRDDEKESKRRR